MFIFKTCCILNKNWQNLTLSRGFVVKPEYIILKTDKVFQTKIVLSTLKFTKFYLCSLSSNLSYPRLALTKYLIFSLKNFSSIFPFKFSWVHQYLMKPFFPPSMHSTHLSNTINILGHDAHLSLSILSSLPKTKRATTHLREIKKQCIKCAHKKLFYLHRIADGRKSKRKTRSTSLKHHRPSRKAFYI